MTPYGTFTRPAEPTAIERLFNNRIMQAAARASAQQRVAHEAQMARFAAVEATAPVEVLDGETEDRQYEDWREWRAENGRSNRWQDYQGGK